MFKKIIYISLIVISLLLFPVLVYITINANKLTSFQKTWLYMICGYISIACFYIGFYNLRKKRIK